MLSSGHRPRLSRSRQHLVHDISANAGQALIEALVKISQLGVIQTHEVQDGGVEVGNVAAIFDGPEAQFIGAADALAAFDAGTGQPHRESMRVMIPAELANSFAGGRSTKLTAPDDQGFVP